jgi:anion-transporting  ArsA/GET3 family ATPase
MGVSEVLAGASLVVCVGPGGVGKTSVAASLGIAAALSGRRTCVLTIDPARRLASALGIVLGDRPTRVPIDAPGELWAAMLDAPASFAAMVDRLELDAALRTRLLEHPMYRAGAGALTRSHAYAAMEWLHDVFAREAYDLVVLDTPPAAVGVEMFDAPGRLLELLDPKVFGWLLAPSERSLLGRVVGGGGALVRKAAASLIGDGTWTSLVDFLGLLARLQPAFVERGAAMSARLRRSDTKFVLISRPEALAIADLEQIADALRERELPIAAAVWNRVPEAIDDPGPLDVEAALAELGLEGARAAALLTMARDARRSCAGDHTAARGRAHASMHRLGITDAAMIPELATMATLGDLRRIAELLVASPLEAAR